MTEPSFYDLPLSFWQEADYWPHGAVVAIIAGGGGHEREITASFHDDDGMPLFDGWNTRQPDWLVGLFISALPEGWTVDDRGSRIEMHPSGRRYGGFDKLDIAAVIRAAEELGFTADLLRFGDG